MPNPQRLYLLISSTPDAFAYGMTTAKQELDAIRQLPIWNLPIARPTLLFQIDMHADLKEPLSLCETYRAVLGEDVCFGAWADIESATSLRCYLTLARNLRHFCEYTRTVRPVLLLDTDRSPAFSISDVSVPVGLGMLSESVPKGTTLYLCCPNTPKYRMMTSLLGISCVKDGEDVEMVTGAKSLEPRQPSKANVLFLAPGWKN